MEEILKAVGVPLVVTDSSGQIEWYSASLAEFVGEPPPLSEWKVGPEEQVLDAWTALVDDPGRPVEVWLNCVGGGAGFIGSAERLDDHWVLTLAPITSLASNSIPGERAPDMWLRLSFDGEIRYSSGPCMGKPAEEIIGGNFLEMLPDEWSEPLRRKFESVRANPRTLVESSTVEVYGEMRSFTSRIVPISTKGEFDELVYQSWETTDTVNAVEALRVTERQYRQVIENSLDLIAIFDASTTVIRFVSPNSLEFLGFRREDVLGHSVFDFVLPDDHEETAQKIENLKLNRREDETIEVRTKHADGRTVLLEARARMLPTGSDEELIIINARDVTIRRESQVLRRSLMRADKLAAIGQVAASVAHEVNNPASFITTNLHVMQEEVATIGAAFQRARDIVGEVAPERLPELEGPDGARVLELLDELTSMLATNLEGMARISHIVRELRSFSRKDNDILEMVDLTETLKAACSMVRNQLSYHANLKEEFDVRLPRVFCERGKISQVIVNLLVNASHAVQKVERKTRHEIKVVAYLSDDSVRVDVIDTGCGVPDGARAQIFEPFFTTKTEEEGTGLGLWLCRDIIEQSGGRLWLERSGPEGSCFSFALPAQSMVEIPPSPFEEISSSAHIETPRANVLLIDDDELVLDAYERILGKHHELTSIQDGEAALRLLESDEFDVVICDIIMPGVDGVDIGEFIATRRPELLARTIFCTAGVFTDRTREFVSNHRDRVVHKPISGRQLKGLVAGVVAKARI